MSLSGKKTYQICTRCVMDTTDPAITFNHKGECNHCIEYLTKRIKHNYQGAKSDVIFKHIITQLKQAGKGKKYDCIVGLSGGVDSSYVASICKKNGLRVLGVHVDNGWNSEQSILNIKNITQTLNIDYESYVLDWEEFKSIQLAFLKASTPEAETPTDIALLAALHIVANKYNVKHIISGGNLATEGILPKHWHYDAKDKKYFNYILKTFGKGSYKTFPFFGFTTEMYYKLIKKIKIIYILNYVPYVKDDIIAELKKEFNWQYYGAKHHESSYTKFIQSYYLYKKFGIDYRRATFSTQICTSELSRQEALKLLDTIPYSQQNYKTDTEFIGKKLGITSNQFNELINLPPKWYSHYPNQQKKLKFIYNSYRKLFKKEKLGNF